MDPSGHGFGADPDLFLKANEQKQKNKKIIKNKKQKQAFKHRLRLLFDMKK